MTVTEITDLLYEATRRKVVMIHRPHKTTSVTTAAIERIPFGGDVVNIDEFGASRTDRPAEDGHSVQRNSNGICAAQQVASNTKPEGITKHR